MKNDKSHMRSIYFAFVITITILSVCSLVSADAVSAAGAYLTWNANSEENLAGYKLYYKLNTGGEPYNGTGANEGNSPVVINLAQLDDPNSPSFSLTGLGAGQTYVFAVKAFGTAGEESDYSNMATLTMSVPPVDPQPQEDNAPPDANAGADQTAPARQTVYLNGDGSSDPDGELAGYEWVQLDGPTVSLSNASNSRASFETPFVGPEGAKLAFRLKVSDAGGLTDSDFCMVTVTYANEAPTASAGPDRTAIVNEMVTLDGTGSKDTDCGLATISWIQKQGPSVALLQAWTSSPRFKVPKTAAAGSQFVFELTVVDLYGLTSSDSCVVTVASSYSVDQNPDAIEVPVPEEPETSPDETPEEVTPEDETPTVPDTTPDTSDETEPASEETPPVVEPGNPAPPEDTTPKDDPEDTEPIVDGNHVPVYPVPVNSGKGLAEVMPVQLTLKKFYDPDPGDSHQKTQWRIYRADDNVCVLSTVSTVFLTTLTAPDIVFDENTPYYWHARFFDNHGAASGWSEKMHFSIGLFKTDEDDDGIPDDQEVDGSVDLNQDGLPDAEQAVVKSILLPFGNHQVGLSIENSDTVTSILSLEAVDPVASNFSPEDEEKANLLPYGLINFKLGVEYPGDTAAVTVHFNAPVPAGMGWMKFDPVKKLWMDYSEHAQFSPDRMSVGLEFVDGGFGDDDGVKNGVIVDPSGPGTPFKEVVVPSASGPAQSIDETADTTGGSSSTSTNTNVPAVKDGDGGGGGGGCFIAGAVGERASGSSTVVLFFLVIGVAFTTSGCRGLGCEKGRL